VRQRYLRILALTSLLALVVVGLVCAQTETGLINGTVTDQTGAVIPKAKVTVRNVGTNAERLSETDSNGFYSASNLLPGIYAVTVEAANLAKKEARAEVTVGARVSLNFQLSVGTTSTIVEVTAEGGVQINTESQTLSTVISSQQITQLPTQDRNPYSLAVSAPTVSEDDPTGRGVGVSINGSRAAGTNVLLDGAANNDEFVAGVGQKVPLDSVQEFSILTNNFTAEYGRADAGIVNVATKSGTNSYHGSAYEVGRWSALSANDFANNANGTPKPIYTRNSFGGSVGGPIKKDKIFFFANPELTRVRSSAVNVGVIPDTAFIGLSNSATQTFFQKFGTLRSGVRTLKTYTGAQSSNCTGPTCSALATANPTTPFFDQVTWLSPGDAGGGAPQNTYDVVGRVDYNLSDKTTFYARYAIYNEIDTAGFVNTSPYAGYDTGQDLRDQNMLLSLVHSFSPSFTEQSKFVYNRIKTIQPLGTNPVGPTLYFRSSSAAIINGDLAYLPGYSATTPGNAIPFGGPQNFFQGYEDLTKTKGRHAFRFGGSYLFLQDNRTFGAYEEAVEGLASSKTSLGTDGFINGQLNNFNVAVYPQGKFPCADPANPTPQCSVTLPLGPPQFSRSNHYTEFAFYGQDSWRLNNRMTVNLGLRWEYYGVQHNSNPQLDSNFYLGGGGNIWQQTANGVGSIAPNSSAHGLWTKDWNNFAPRVGFAWDVFGNGKTAFRGGYGIGYERNFGNVTFNVLFNPPNFAILSLNGAQAGPVTSSNLGPFSGSGITKPIPPTQDRWVDQNIRNAYAHLYSATLEHQFSSHLLVGIDYSGSKGQKLYSIAAGNECGGGNVYLGIPVGTGVGTVNSSFPLGSLACGPDGLTGTQGLVRLNTAYSYLNHRGSDGNSLYNAAIVRLDFHNLGNSGLTLHANYVYSRTEDDLSDTFSSSGNDFNLGYTDAYNPKVDWGPSQFDNRHRGVVTAIWEVPFGKHAHGWQKQVADGWTVSSIFTARSGNPFTIWDCAQASPFANNPCPRVAYTGAFSRTISAANSSTADPNTPNLWNIYSLSPFTTANANYVPYVNPIVGYSDFGPFPSSMMGRNIFRSPGNYDVDLGAFKSFFLTERFKLTLRGEAFNSLNHANLFLDGGTACVGCGGSSVTAHKAGHRNTQFTVRLDF
jgi:hypothetical protein